ncbi:MAG: carbohydrate binding domain-containing protein [Muricauda sp.]|nr:carbohydrate binding domain-containing protein [Allomuricauda sp.]MBO6588509.1 carbohydrate binding domain-containing protein [Allomuricauda sp.]MBO6618351.1 carbohydrate binding domain-containing protein [Allomuricauda sp.]MBO6644047.1 carbohydrate binding domain-containing protein [Allomuricauda sp.]MBO6746931.1 carbohydrate binding domain-containing protein [Allomuricauda sp.]MBO6845062.1 carbohydrate binding domain-containing protein [Allomuricauda sp.]
MKQLITKFKLVSVFVLALLVGCESDDSTLLPTILSNFTFTLDEDTGTVEFINISEKATSYQWDFGDGDTSTEINPIKTYTASGTYTVVLTASNTAGATSTFEDEITIVIKEPITLPITFDNNNVNYDLGVSTFNGAAFEILDNPDVSGTNDKSSKVGKITNSGAAFEGIFFDLGTPVDLSTEQTITADFWSEEPIDILMKLELGTGSDTEVSASHGGTGWETVSFNFASTESYSRITLFVDGPGTTAGDFFIDDVEQVETATTPSGCVDTPVAAAALPVDFEGCETFLSSENFGDGITSGLAENPSKAGINTSDFVLQVDKPTGSSFFAGIQNTFENNFDLATTDVFKLKVYSTKANVVFRFELALNPQTDPVTGNPAPVFVTIPNANEWTEVEFTFTNLPGGPTAYNQLVIKPDNDEVDSAITEGGTYYIDDLTLGTSGGGSGGSGFDDGLLTNGDFENGSAPWILGVDDAAAAPVTTEGGNSFYSVNVTTPDPGQPFLVNLSQKLEIIQDETYTLTFDAWSDTDRPIIAGIGLSGGSFANTTETVNINITRQTYSVVLTASGFGAPDARVLFDLNGAAGLVNIDNVSLVVGGTTVEDTTPPVITLNGDATVDLNVGDSYTEAGATATDDTDGDISGNIVVGGDTVDTSVAGTYIVTYNVSDAAGNAATEVTRTVNVIAFDDGLLTNGDFENGSAPWILGVDDAAAAPVTTENGNSFYSVNVTTPDPGQPFLVNLSQKLEIIQDETYTLSFDAWSDTDRPIIAGIGLSGGSFANTTETVNINTTRQTYSVVLTATGFGAPDARVLFDLNGAAGLVNIDNVSLVVGGSGGGGGATSGCTGTPVAATSLPLDFEGCETFLSAFSSIGDGGVVPSLAANPDPSGINTSDNVLQVVRASGINRWGGVQNSFTAGTIDITTQTFKVMVYSSVPDVTYRFELALDPQTDPVTGNPPPTFVQVSGGANTWTEIEFTFTGLPASPTTYNQLVIKPDNPSGSDGELTTEERIFYFDNLRLD